MSINDLDDVIEIENSLFSDPWPKSQFVYELTENDLSHYFVLKIDGKIIGYAGIWFLFENGDITNIAIRKEYQHQGYGELLLKHLISLAKENDCDYLHLEVRVSNISAINLYQKYHFNIMRTIKAYYSDNYEDAYSMLKIIKGSENEEVNISH